MDETEDYGGVVPLVQGVFPGTQVAVEITARTSTVAATAVDRVKAAAAYRQCKNCEDINGVFGGKAAGQRHKDIIGPHYPVAPRWVTVTPPGTTIADMKLFRQAGLVNATTAVVPRLGCGLIGRDKANAEETRRCYGNVADAIWAAGVDYVVLIGRDACEMWRGDRAVGELDGRIGVMWDRYVVMAVRDVRWMRDTPNRVEKKMMADALKRHVERWRGVVGEEGTLMTPGYGVPAVPVTRFMAESCVECGKGVDWMDRDALGWCREHRNGGWLKARGLPANHGVQEGMF